MTDDCFVQILAKEKGYTAINEGVVGNMAVGIKNQLDTGELDSYIEQAQIVPITCGGNDLMALVCSKTADLYNKYYGGTSPLTSDDFISNLNQVTAYIKEKI